MFVAAMITSIPYVNARRQIMLDFDGQFVTEEVIERELARRFPKLYSFRLYSGVIMIGMLVVTYVVAFVVILMVVSKTLIFVF